MRVIQPAVLDGDALPPLLSPSEFSIGTKGAIKFSDPRLPALLDGASAAIRRYCGWHIAPLIEDVYTLDYDGGSIVTLQTLRLVDVLALKVWDHEYSAEELASLKWSHNGEIAFPHPGRGMYPGAGFRAINVAMQHGFDLDAVADVKQIVQQVVGNAIASPMGATKEQAGQVAISWSTTAPGVSGGISLLERDYAVLNQYKLPGRA